MNYFQNILCGKVAYLVEYFLKENVKKRMELIINFRSSPPPKDQLINKLFYLTKYFCN